MRNRVLHLLLSMLGLLLSCAVSIADVHYVSPDGGHIHPYTNWADAATGVQAAVDAAASGDSVLVAGAHYWIRETITLTNPITLRGISGPEHTVIDGSNSVRCLTIQSAGAMVAGITLTRGYDSDRGGGILIEAESIVSNCVITSCRADWGGGVFLMEAGALMSSVVRDNVAGAAGGVAAIGDIRLENSFVYGNRAIACGGIECDFSSFVGAPEIIDCTITANMAEEAAGGIFFHHFDFDPFEPIPSPLVVDTIVYGNLVDTYPEAAEYEGDTQYVDFLACCLNPLPPRYHIGNITNDPQLTPSYRLKSSSPCIDAGTLLYAPPTDIDGEARWDHPGHSNTWSVVDIGADEFVDTDADDMADHWEDETFGSNTNSNGSTDGDNDDLDDLGEYENSTDPGNADSDADQMPDGWEVGNELNPLTNDADQDPDADTMNNGGEYVADTNPHDPLSVLSVINVAAELGGIRVDWKGGRDAWQFLECCPDLASTTNQWTAILAVPPPTSITNAIIDLGTTNQVLFYRIRSER